MSPWIEILVGLVIAIASWILGQFRVSAMVSRRLIGPLLCWDVNQQAGAEVRVPLGQPAGAIAHYFRVSVTNTKKRAATSVRAYLIDVRAYDSATKSYPSMGMHDAIPLIWSYRNTDPVEIPYGITQYLDLVDLTLDSAGALISGPSLRIAPLPILYQGALASGGKYAMRVLIQADDYVLVDDICVTFEWDGNQTNPSVAIRPFRSFHRDFA